MRGRHPHLSTPTRGLPSRHSAERQEEPLRREAYPTGIRHRGGGAPGAQRPVPSLTMKGRAWQIRTAPSPPSPLGQNRKHRADRANFPDPVGLGKPIRARNKPLAWARGHDTQREHGGRRPHRPPHLQPERAGPRRRPAANSRLSRTSPFCREKLMKGRSLGNYELPPAISPSKERGAMAG